MMRNDGKEPVGHGDNNGDEAEEGDDADVGGLGIRMRYSGVEGSGYI
jgi:hypothetical protein